MIITVYALIRKMYAVHRVCDKVERLKVNGKIALCVSTKK